MLKLLVKALFRFQTIIIKHKILFNNPHNFYFYNIYSLKNLFNYELVGTKKVRVINFSIKNTKLDFINSASDYFQNKHDKNIF